jgi:nuclear transcription Y subunit beta
VLHAASDKCQQEKRKTINGDDLLWAMSTLGFDKYVEPLKAYLAKYREVRLVSGLIALRASQ